MTVALHDCWRSLASRRVHIPLDMKGAAFDRSAAFGTAP
ncbi:hypothetical protein SAMN06265378_102211 [Paracoccus sediminis]|uniref:Uncharacterized protein n=1 Tax=Paracoccus sediminis TaxID=1214787 RepID=A0A238VHI8_9RHOB|nr:hypothetical protein SAMN06265378_102211 [Paracoccus sediminis]